MLKQNWMALYIFFLIDSILVSGQLVSGIKTGSARYFSKKNYSRNIINEIQMRNTTPLNSARQNFWTVLLTECC